MIYMMRWCIMFIKITKTILPTHANENQQRTYQIKLSLLLQFRRLLSCFLITFLEVVIMITQNDTSDDKWKYNAEFATSLTKIMTRYASRFNGFSSSKIAQFWDQQVVFEDLFKRIYFLEKWSLSQDETKNINKSVETFDFDNIISFFEKSSISKQYDFKNNIVKQILTLNSSSKSQSISKQFVKTTQISFFLSVGS